ncbi:hypothetical protein PISMIDRAFT_311068 [Pisolithus microcarpus 441]|uniref:Uncharacterized protein n=1 Tax=Pisolithus microcarpus 441 TaxID=765257 RepID=A0A0C9ZMY8_9AGAM|nr:hypothetical protein PISMIDRAFT_311068 [Pisolithus microcarpus 441]
MPTFPPVFYTGRSGNEVHKTISCDQVGWVSDCAMSFRTPMSPDSVENLRPETAHHSPLTITELALCVCSRSCAAHSAKKFHSLSTLCSAADFFSNYVFRYIASPRQHIGYG